MGNKNPKNGVNLDFRLYSAHTGIIQQTYGVVYLSGPHYMEAAIGREILLLTHVKICFYFGKIIENTNLSSEKQPNIKNVIINQLYTYSKLLTILTCAQYYTDQLIGDISFDAK